MKETSTKPYLIRAIYEWCIDSGFSPYVVVKVNANTVVPVEYIKDGEITLNISHTAASNLEIGNDVIIFKARFDGSSRNIQIPVNTVKGVYAKEINQGLSFAIANETKKDSSSAVNEVLADDSQEVNDTKQSKPTVPLKKKSSNTKSHLQIVK